MNGLKDNVERNHHVVELSNPSTDSCHITAPYSDNSCKTDEENSLDNFRNVVVQELDWSDRNNELYNSKWDFVIGADIIYIEESFPHLLRTMKQLQTDFIILSCRLRYDKDHRFIELTKKDFIVEQLLFDETKEVHIFKFLKLHVNE